MHILPSWLRMLFMFNLFPSIILLVLLLDALLFPVCVMHITETAVSTVIDEVKVLVIHKPSYQKPYLVISNMYLFVTVHK